MGQYKQWLEYREQGQHLRTALMLLEQEQEQLQEEIDRLATTTHVTQNPIIQALLTKQKLELAQKKQPALQESESRGQGQDDICNLLPADINAFVDAHSLTDPQLKVPWWLRNLRSTTEQAVGEQSPIDQQSERTNRSVERFFQRWNDQTLQAPGKQAESTHRRADDPGTR